MSVREKQQMNLDTESATHTRMKDQPRSSYKYQLLQAWCSLLTVAMVIMAVRLGTINQKPTEAGVPTPLPINTTSPPQRQIQEPLKSGMSRSFIQLVHPPVWKVSEHQCKSCSLVLHENSIYVNKIGTYFLYAQVTFRKESDKDKRVFLQRTGFHDGNSKPLAEGIYPALTDSSVWVAKIVKLRKHDSVTINITGEILKDYTYWGAIELH